MRENYRRMLWLIRVFGLKSFYRIEFDKDHVTAYVDSYGDAFNYKYAATMLEPTINEFDVAMLVRDKYKIIIG